jgi:hypothetical protein
MNHLRPVGAILAISFLLPGLVGAADAKKEPAPITNRVNAEMPNWLRFSGEERVRMEFIDGQGFKSVRDLYLLNRLRFNADVKPTSWLKFSFQMEDSRVFGQNTRPAPATQKEAADLRIGFVQIGHDEGLFNLRAGRQVMDFGEGRLIGDPGWSNVGRTFDAARLNFHYGPVKVAAFTGAVVKIDQTSFDQPFPAEHIHGMYGWINSLVPNAVVEPYLFWRLEHSFKSETGRVGNMDEKTVGFRWTGKLPVGFDYGVDMAAQRGSWAGDNIGAWMGHWMIGHPIAKSRYKPKMFVELNRLSGDADPRDGRRGTFDSLFPAAHDKYGVTDLFTSGNIVHLRPGVQLALRKNLNVSVAYNSFWLANESDGLYVGGKVVARSKFDGTGIHVGQEGDVQMQWAPSKASQFILGYGRLFPGEFLRHSVSGVPYNLFFLGLAQRF